MSVLAVAVFHHTTYSLGLALGLVVVGSYDYETFPNFGNPAASYPAVRPNRAAVAEMVQVKIGSAVPGCMTASALAALALPVAVRYTLRPYHPVEAAGFAVLSYFGSRLIQQDRLHHRHNLVEALAVRQLPVAAPLPWRPVRTASDWSTEYPVAELVAMPGYQSIDCLLPR